MGGGRVLVGDLGGTSERCDEFNGCKPLTMNVLYTTPRVCTD